LVPASISARRNAPRQELQYTRAAGALVIECYPASALPL